MPEGWLAGAAFQEAVINPMSDADRTRFVQKWHDAVLEQLRRDRRLSDERRSSNSGGEPHKEVARQSVPWLGWQRTRCCAG